MSVLFFDPGQFLGPPMQVHLQIMKHLDRQTHKVFLATNTEVESRVDSYLPEDVVVEKYNLGGPFRDEYRPGEHARQILRHLPTAASLARIVRLIGRQRIDVIHCTSEPRAALMGAIMSIASGAKLVVQAHTWNLDRAFLKRTPVKFALDRAHAVIADSHYIEGELVRVGVDPAKIRTIWPGVDLEAFHPSVDGSAVRERYGVPPSTPLVVTAGRITSEKGQVYLVEALESIRHEIPEVKVLLVGWSDPARLSTGKTYEQELRELCARRGIEDVVVFTGPTTDMPEVWAAADLAVVPSIGAEGFGLVAVEAMATGKAVVGTDSGGLPEILAEDAGVVVPKADTEALAQAVTGMLKNKSLRQRKARAARKRVEELFYEGRPALLVKDVYASVLGRV